jgi:signal transduction histidine kinase
VSNAKSPGEPLIEALAAGIAHEVRNPLNALQINLQTLEQELAKVLPDRQARAFMLVERIAKELGSLDNFVSEFLRFARPAPLKRERINVPSLLTDLATFIGPECGRKDVALRVSTEKGPMWIVADNFQIKHALLNLVLNGLQATPGGGGVSIESTGSEGFIHIQVRDTGDGIPDDVLDKVFEVFFTTREGGTGLGLPIARRIVEAHGGTLDIASVFGKGTTATITLPLGG